jgi:hypothetical protein
LKPISPQTLNPFNFHSPFQLSKQKHQRQIQFLSIPFQTQSLL